jgi:chromate transporter
MIYLKIFFCYLQIGLFSIGGGHASIPLIRSMIVDDRAWLSVTEFVDMITISEMTPGPFAINIATYVGMVTGRSQGGLGLLGGFLGSACATLGVVVPSFVIILIVARIYKKFQESNVVKGCMTGLRPTVIGLIAGAVLTIGQTVFFPNGFALSGIDPYAIITSLVICLIGIFLIFKKKVHPIVLIVVSAVLGIAAGYVGKLF